MKKLMIAAAALFYLSSCTGVAGWFGSEKDSTEHSAKGPVAMMQRDESITAANAYSDLFLDSAAINNYIQKQNLDGNKAQMMRNFYAVRNNQYAWFTSNGMTEQARGFWSLNSSKKDSASGKDENKLKPAMDSLMQQDSVRISNTDSSYVQTELAMTDRLIDFASSNNGSITTDNIYYLVPRKKISAIEWAEALLNKTQDTTVHRDTSAYASNPQYNMMKQQLQVYYNAAKNGGWQPLASANGLKKGSKSPAVVALKQRLQATNDYPAGDTTNVYNDSLANAVKAAQRTYGLKETGMVNDSLVTALNVPAEQRLQQIIINMNRALWEMPVTDSNRIEVNIPAQMLYAYNDSGKVLEMPVIVGEEGTNTMAFSGRISQVVFNPTWNVPESIVKNEIMPAMKKDPGYLKKHNMEITGQHDSVPEIKQLPGKENSLGHAKFLFPNSYDIYLHDTPNKSLFKQSDRRLSHGCIRVADAAKLAQYVLQNQSEWTPEKIRQAMTGNQEQKVAVNNPKPVHITYLTAWVDPSGKMNFRNDVYNHDSNAMAMMFTGGMSNVAGNNQDSTGRAMTPNADTTAKRTTRP
jgi:murein L,D-transpeptidase YcbB/YkuD